MKHNSRLTVQTLLAVTVALVAESAFPGLGAIVDRLSISVTDPENKRLALVDSYDAYGQPNVVKDGVSQYTPGTSL